MIFDFLLHRKPEPLPDTPVRGLHGQFTESPRTRRRRSLAASVEAQLAVYCAVTTQEQRAADFQAYLQSASNGRPIYEGKRRATNG